MKTYNIFLILIFCLYIFTFNVRGENINQDKDSLAFSLIEKEFNSLMDTSNLANYKKFKDAYSDIILITSYPGAKYDFTKFDKLYKKAKNDLNNKIKEFSLIDIPSSLPPKVITRLNESKDAFIKAYKTLLNAIERLFLYAKKRLGIYLIDYNNYMLKFEGQFNKGIIKFAQAKMKIN